MRFSHLLAVVPLALAAPSFKRAPLITSRDAEVVEGKFIVKMKPSAGVSAASSAIQSIAADADLSTSDLADSLLA